MQMPIWVHKSPPKKAQLRAPPSPSKQPLTLICAAVEHPQQTPLWWKVHVATGMSTMPPDGVQCIPLHQSSFQQGWCHADGLTGLWGLTAKVQSLSACLHTTQAPQTASGSVTDLGWLA